MYIHLYFNNSGVRWTWVAGVKRDREEKANMPKWSRSWSPHPILGQCLARTAHVSRKVFKIYLGSWGEAALLGEGVDAVAYGGQALVIRLSLTHSLSHTHTHTHTRSLSLSFSLSHTKTHSLSISHTHTRAHTHLGGWGENGHFGEGKDAVTHGGEALVIRLPIKRRKGLIGAVLGAVTPLFVSFWRRLPTFPEKSSIFTWAAGVRRDCSGKAKMPLRTAVRRSSSVSPTVSLSLYIYMYIYTYIHIYIHI